MSRTFRQAKPHDMETQMPLLCNRRGDMGNRPRSFQGIKEAQTQRNKLQNRTSLVHPRGDVQNRICYRLRYRNPPGPRERVNSRNKLR